MMKDEQDEFYIGWQDEAPTSFKKIRTLFFSMAILLLLGFAWFFARAEVGFIDSYFDYGNLTEVKGRLVTEPVPALLTMVSGQIKTVPLVGFGKFGAGPVLESFKAKLGPDLSQHEVVIRGTLFYYKDKQWMELTEGSESLVSFSQATSLIREVAEGGTVTLSGEIVDPKCFFGVMNPATKAVHRSCARRCISGGIVPVLAIREAGQFVDYYLLQDGGSGDIFQDILPYVGVPVTITGAVKQYDDWKVLTINHPSLTQIAVHPDPTIATCLD